MNSSTTRSRIACRLHERDVRADEYGAERIVDRRDRGHSQSSRTERSVASRHERERSPSPAGDRTGYVPRTPLPTTVWRRVQTLAAQPAPSLSAVAVRWHRGARNKRLGSRTLRLRAGLVWNLRNFSRGMGAVALCQNGRSGHASHSV